MHVIRKILSDDAEALAAHLLRLDPVARHCRFAAHLSDAAIREHVARIDWRRSLHLGTFEQGAIRAAASLAWEPPLWPRAAELGLSVEPPLQDHGIGTELVQRVLVLARNRGITRITMLCLPDNVRMQHIARKLDARLAFADGAIEGELRLRLPDALSVLQEVVDDGVAAFERLTEPAAA